jgi:hypothetical protein
MLKTLHDFISVPLDLLMVGTEVKKAWSFTTFNAYSQEYSGDITAAEILTFFRQVCPSNLDHDTCYSDSTFRGFPKSLQETVTKRTSVNPRLLLNTSCHVTQDSLHW